MINHISRVIGDVLTITGDYFLVLLAFSFGIYFVLKANVNPYTSSEINIKKQIEENTTGEMSFFDISKTLFWALLNPGPDTETFPRDGFTGFLTNALFLFYQLFVVIMLLTLLIAMMNSTMQKIQDKRLLYWKFCRTLIWIDFINEGYVIPPPFTTLYMVLLLVLCLVSGSYYYMWLLYRKIANKKEITLSMVGNDNDMNRKSSKKYNCKMDPNEGKRRKNHAILMKKLINNLLQKERKVSPGTSLVHMNRKLAMKYIQNH